MQPPPHNCLTSSSLPSEHTALFNMTTAQKVNRDIIPHHWTDHGASLAQQPPLSVASLPRLPVVVSPSFTHACCTVLKTCKRGSGCNPARSCECLPGRNRSNCPPMRKGANAHMHAYTFSLALFHHMPSFRQHRSNSAG